MPKWTFPVSKHVQLLRPAKRRRLSSMNTSQISSGKVPTFYSQYFFTNALYDNTPPHSVHLPAQTGPDAVKALHDDPHFQHDMTMLKPNPSFTISHLLKIYGQLSKSRLTFLIVLTSMSGVALSPFPTTVPILLSTAIGTALCSSCANTINQIREVPFDAQMARTRLRPLVRGAISPTHAMGFAAVTGLTGPAILAAINPISAWLGAVNIILYSGVYTSLKRTSVVNTWVGSIVGGIPPLIGWTACGGKIFPSASYPIELFPPSFFSDLASTMSIIQIDNPLSALALFSLLFSWQFPHFNSLAHLVRESYAQGGYKMLAAINPRLNALVAFRHSIGLIVICSVLTPLSGLTTWAYAITSMIPNAFLTRAAWRFWRSGTEKDARALWHISLSYLPIVLALMMCHKQGMDWLTFLGWSKGKEEKGMVQGNVIAQE
ncbi:protoheme IX farnesyltransferase [Hysterangium stoloniferum]|nr:protoheme IX farnesyltransferase [Hysterangium stoloniferum]